MIIPRSKIPSLIDALLNLDGTKDKPSKFSPKTRYSLAKNLRLLTRRFEDIEKVRVGIVRELNPKTFQIDKGSPEGVEYTKRWEEFNEGTPESPALEDFPNLMRFTLAELNLDVNELPVAVLAKLGPILIEDDEVPAVAPAAPGALAAPIAAAA